MVFSLIFVLRPDPDNPDPYGPAPDDPDARLWSQNLVAEPAFCARLLTLPFLLLSGMRVSLPKREVKIVAKS